MPSFSSWHWVYSMPCLCFYKYEINIRVKIVDILLCKTSLNSYHQINPCVCNKSHLHTTHKPLIFDCLQTQEAVTHSNILAPEELPCRFHLLQDVSGNVVGFFSPLIEVPWKCHETYSAPAVSTNLFCASRLSEGDTRPQFPLLSWSSSHSMFCVVCSFITVLMCNYVYAYFIFLLYMYIFTVLICDYVYINVIMTDYMLLTCHESLPGTT